MNKQRNALQIGNFGGNLKQVDGQTVKTKLFGSLLDDIYHKTIKIDIYNYNLIDYFIFFIMLPIKIYRSSDIFIGVGMNGMKLITPWLIIWSLIFKKRVFYYVIGGWVFELLAKNKYLIFFFKKFHTIFVELPSMIKAGEAFGLKNISFFPNFRKTNFSPNSINKINNKTELKLVYYSRVIKEKGILIAIDAVNTLRTENINISLDIYGPLYDDSILLNIEKNGNINYLGILSPENDVLYHTLNQYDLLVFPTYYIGEGFPGTITDAFISGIPIIASNWKYNSEIITPGFNGDLFPTNNINALCDLIKKYYSDPIKTNRMRDNALISANKDSYIEAKRILQKTISK